MNTCHKLLLFKFGQDVFVNQTPSLHNRQVASDLCVIELQDHRGINHILLLNLIVLRHNLFNALD